MSSKPWGVLYVDGKKVAEETPVYRLPLPAGSHRAAVYYPERGDYSATLRFELRAGETRALGFKP